MNFRLQLSPRDRRAMTLGALLLLPALGWSVVVTPYRRAHADLRSRVAEQRELLTRERALVESGARFERDLRDANDAADNAQYRLLPQRDALAATGALVSLVGEKARRHNVLLESVESRGAEPVSGGLTAVRIEVRGRGDLEGLLRWLRAIETDVHLLRVDGLSLSRVGQLAEAGPDSLDIETLAMSATVRGYVRVAESK